MCLSGKHKVLLPLKTGKLACCVMKLFTDTGCNYHCLSPLHRQRTKTSLKMVFNKSIWECLPCKPCDCSSHSWSNTAECSSITVLTNRLLQSSSVEMCNWENIKETAWLWLFYWFWCFRSAFQHTLLVCIINCPDFLWICHHSKHTLKFSSKK